jgi:hypothetical protein
MTEVIGDIVQPSELILPKIENSTGAVKAGSIKLSGSKIWFYTGTAWSLVTSS